MKVGRVVGNPVVAVPVGPVRAAMVRVPAPVAVPVEGPAVAPVAGLVEAGLAAGNHPVVAGLRPAVVVDHRARTARADKDSTLRFHPVAEDADENLR